MPTIRADFGQAVWLNPEDGAWASSPEGGVSRLMLDRVGDEVAVATSFVRYAPESSFPGHGHALGEEFIVLEGEFGDEHGRYPPGSYVRNPPGSKHVPFSEPGCLIWVKLRQFQADDQTQLVAHLDSPIPENGVQIREIHQFERERVAEVVLAAGENLALPAVEQPQELLVLEGELQVAGQRLERWGWLREPAGQSISLTATAPSRLLWKTRPVG